MYECISRHMPNRKGAKIPMGSFVSSSDSRHGSAASVLFQARTGVISTICKTSIYWNHPWLSPLLVHFQNGGSDDRLVQEHACTTDTAPTRLVASQARILIRSFLSQAPCTASRSTHGRIITTLILHLAVLLLISYEIVPFALAGTTVLYFRG